MRVCVGLHKWGLWKGYKLVSNLGQPVYNGEIATCQQIKGNEFKASCTIEMDGYDDVGGGGDLGGCDLMNLMFPDIVDNIHSILHDLHLINGFKTFEDVVYEQLR
ncbi:hypothetical protein Tco_0782967 [Tanacetum coccineum]